MELLVVGAGEMGRWLADTIELPVAFADLDQSIAADAAASRQDARAVDPETDERFAAVCLAVPISAVESAIEAYAPNAADAIFDISGVMTPAIEAMDEYAADLERASYHPLFAPPRVPGNIAAVSHAIGPTLEVVAADFEAAGNTVFETTPEEHDRAMESVQAAAHAAILSYALATADVRTEFSTPVSKRLDGLVGTVTEGSPDVYAEIQSAFSGADRVAAAAAEIATADRDQFVELYRNAGTDTTARQRHD